MNNDFLYKYLLFIANKAVTGNTISPEEFNIALKAANLTQLKKKIGLPEDYRPGVPVPRQSVEITQMLTDDILPFKVHMGAPNVQPLVVDANGYATIPDDFFYPKSFSYRYFPNNDCEGSFDPKKVDVLTDQQWDYVTGSAIRRPTLQYPACNFQAGVIRFSPKNIGMVDFVYLRMPVTPVYDYYINAIGEHIYLEPGTTYLLDTDEEGSQGQTAGTVVTSLSAEAEWDDINKLDIISFVLADLGINIREGMLQQFAEMSKQTGT